MFMIPAHLRARLKMVGRSRAPVLLLLCGIGVVALIVAQPPPEKIAIVVSTLGLLSILIAVHLLGRQGGSFALVLSESSLRYLTLVIGVSMVLLASLPFSPRIEAIGFAAALTLVFFLCVATNLPKLYVAFFTVCLFGLMGYRAFYYYPPVTATDSWGYLAVASATLQVGHFVGFVQPTDAYYIPFPVMAIVTSILSSITGLQLQTSLLVFPGSLILMQPLLVFLVSRSVFHDSKIAAVSAFIILTESEVVQWVRSPIAQSTAISLGLVILILLSARIRSRAHAVVAFTLFLILVALHGAVALGFIVLISYLMLRERSSRRQIILPLAMILAGYIAITAVIARIVGALQLTAESVLEFILTPGHESPLQIPLYGSGTFGLIFLWWGLPVSLAILCILVYGWRQAQATWAYAGLGLIGLSFVVGAVAPSLAIDRYGGLPAWLLLAVSSGYVLSRLARTSRQLLVLVPVIMLVCLSTMTSPITSPQSADQWYHGFLPTTQKDNTALDWVSVRVTKSVFSDTGSASYLIFSRYESGLLSAHGIAKLTKILMYPTTPPPHAALFVRCSSIFVTCGAGEICRTYGPSMANERSEQAVNVLYNNGCDLLEATPAWV